MLVLFSMAQGLFPAGAGVILSVHHAGKSG